MNKEEIKEYLKRVDELEFKLVDEDKDTLQWLIFGYNECARLLNEKEKENQRLKEIEKEHQKMNGELRVENQKYKEVINKAIEFTNKNWGTWCTHHLEYMTELQDILKGVK